jgi:hypothetical protein
MARSRKLQPVGGGGGGHRATNRSDQEAEESRYGSKKAAYTPEETPESEWSTMEARQQSSQEIGQPVMESTPQRQAWREASVEGEPVSPPRQPRGPGTVDLDRTPNNPRNAFTQPLITGYQIVTRGREKECLNEGRMDWIKGEVDHQMIIQGSDDPDGRARGVDDPGDIIRESADPSANQRQGSAGLQMAEDHARQHKAPGHGEPAVGNGRSGGKGGICSVLELQKIH